MSKKEDAIYQGEQNFAPFPLSISSPVIKPIEKRLEKANAFDTMKMQAEQQIQMLKTQADVIMKQVREIENRLSISYKIYEADINFVPVIGNNYYLYLKKNNIKILSMIGPHEWGKKLPFESYIATVQLMPDKTWKIIDLNPNETI